MDESHLQLELESPSPVTRTITGEIAWEPVRDKLDEAYKELGKTITLKGFRKGKVPKGMLKKMFHKRIAAEISHTLVQEALVDAITRLELRPVAPIPSWDVDEKDIVEGEALGFTATLEVLPEVEITEYEGLEVNRREAKVSDEDIDQFLQTKQNELTQYLPVEKTDMAVGHIVRCDVMGKIGGEPVSMEGLTFQLNDPDAEADEDPGPDPERAAMISKVTGELLGSRPEDAERDLEFTWGEDAPEAWASKEAQILVEIEAVRERKAPELDDDFARDAGEAETLVEYREIVRKQLLEADEERVKQDLRRSVEEALIEKNPLEVSETLVERQLNSVMERAQMAFQMRGVSPDIFGMDNEKLRDQFRSSAEAEVKKTLLTDALAKKLEVKVSDDELEERLKEIAEARSESLERVKAEYEKNAGSEALRVVMREEKVLDLLLDSAHVTTVEGSDEAETEDPENAEKSSVDAAKEDASEGPSESDDSEQKES
jgi:trigger factor